MSELLVQQNSSGVVNGNEGKDGVSSMEFVELREKQTRDLMESYKLKNETLLGKIFPSNSTRVIQRAEIDILVDSLKSQQNEMKALQETRLKGLQRNLEFKLIEMGTDLQKRLGVIFEQNLFELSHNMGIVEKEFVKTIEDFEVRIATYKIPYLQQSATKAMYIQIDAFYNSMNKLISDYQNLTESMVLGGKK